MPQFLAFFKLSIKLFAVLFFFAAVVLEPINRKYVPDQSVLPLPDPDDPDRDNTWNYDMGYLWAYLVFTYFFALLTILIVDKETYKIIRIRQDYLGTQSTITDRTFRLSGIPVELRSESKIKKLVERLEIGNVESITLCRNWKELDDLVYERTGILHKLEEIWSVFMAQEAKGALDARRHPISNALRPDNGDEAAVDDEEAGVTDRLLNPGLHQYIQRPRPQTRIWYGFLRLRYKKTDAIDYYEEKLHRIDEKIRTARKKEYEPVDQAFVTMDSIAACQMATQALIDPRPGQLLTKQAPAPSDVVWHNTYATKSSRRVRSWIITIFITILSIIWLLPVAAFAGLLSLCTIGKVFPDLAEFLNEHEIIKALVQTGLPTVVVSLLNVAVPFAYEYLSNQQGMLSQGEVELSIVSKNFFFTFFNIFLVFTVFGTASKIWTVLKDSFKDTTYIARQLAAQIQTLNVFYLNFIMLQGLGLFPFRLLEFGAVSLYPINRLGAKTPRDFANTVIPPVFSYGFYLPTALLVFILCLVYSVLPRGYIVLAVGIMYFFLGYFTYKYQLLYAMEQPQHATGGAWRIICYRIVLGLIVFQITMAGYLVLQSAFFASSLVIPLSIGTVWYSYAWKRRFEPLTKYIALRSIRRNPERGNDDNSSNTPIPGSSSPDAALEADEDSLMHDEIFGGPGRHPIEALRRRRSTVDEDREKGAQFINPSYLVPLEQPWIYRDPPPLMARDSRAGLGGGDGLEFRHPFGPEGSGIGSGSNGNGNGGGGGEVLGVPSASSNSSSFSLGDTHIWRQGDRTPS